MGAVWAIKPSLQCPREQLPVTPGNTFFCAKMLCSDGNSQSDGDSPPPPSYMLLTFTVQSMELISQHFRNF